MRDFGQSAGQYFSYDQLQGSEAGRQMFQYFVRAEYPAVSNGLMIFGLNEAFRNGVHVDRATMDDMARILTETGSFGRLNAIQNYIRSRLGSEGYSVRREVRCFAGDTLIRLASGYDRPISSIRAGDLVASSELSLGRAGLRQSE